MEIRAPRTRRVILQAVSPAVTLIGHLKIPVKSLMTVADYESLRATHILPGTVLVCRKRLHASNLIIPGEWKHVAIYIGGPLEEVVEAVYPKVRRIPLKEWVLKQDYIMALSPKFARTAQMQRVADLSVTLVGKRYDLLVSYSPNPRVNRAFYCSEIPWWCYDRILKEDGQESSFTPRETMGVPTVVPQDYPNAVPAKWTAEWQRPRLSTKLVEITAA